MKKVIETLIVILLMVMFACSSNHDFEEEIAQQKIYCELVLAGDWGDYKGVKDECGRVSGE